MALKAVPGIGAEIVLTVDGEMRKARLSAGTNRQNSRRPLRTRGRCLGDGLGVNHLRSECLGWRWPGWVF